MHDRQPALASDDLRHEAPVARVDMLHNDDDRAERCGQLAENLGQGADAAG